MGILTSGFESQLLPHPARGSSRSSVASLGPVRPSDKEGGPASLALHRSAGSLLKADSGPTPLLSRVRCEWGLGHVCKEPESGHCGDSMPWSSRQVSSFHCLPTVRNAHVSRAREKAVSENAQPRPPCVPGSSAGSGWRRPLGLGPAETSQVGNCLLPSLSAFSAGSLAPRLQRCPSTDTVGPACGQAAGAYETLSMQPAPGGKRTHEARRPRHKKTTALGRMTLATECVWLTATVLRRRQSTPHRRSPETLSLSQAWGVGVGRKGGLILGKAALATPRPFPLPFGGGPHPARWKPRPAAGSKPWPLRLACSVLCCHMQCSWEEMTAEPCCLERWRE